jgi:hypothetical protein
MKLEHDIFRTWLEVRQQLLQDEQGDFKYSKPERLRALTRHYERKQELHNKLKGYYFNPVEYMDSQNARMRGRE